MIKHSREDVKIVKGFKIMSLVIQLKELDLCYPKEDQTQGDMTSYQLSEVMSYETKIQRTEVGLELGLETTEKQIFDLIQRKTS